MSARTYCMDDASLTLPGGYTDRTSNVIEWSLEGGDKVVLVVQRDWLPPAGGADAFARYVAAQTRVYPSRFEGFYLERDEVAAGDAGFAMCRKVFRWRREQDVLYHHQVFVLLGAGVLVLTASAKALHRDAVDHLLEGALGGLQVRGEDHGP